jgi:hypothetical protein
MGGVSRTAAVVSLREWSVKTLALEPEQKAAAERFCRSWETVHRVRTNATSFGERVDNGKRQSPFSERSLTAAQDLRHCRILLGEHGYALVGKVCGDGYHIRDLYRTRRERDMANDLLKIHLTALAAMWY